MAESSKKYVVVSTRDDLLITQEIARKLVQHEPSSRIFVACPSPCMAGAQVWVDEIKNNNSNVHIHVLQFNPYGDRAACRRASEELIQELGDGAIAALAMNWQGCLPGRFGVVLEESGMLEMAQIKILSQLYFIETLIEKKMLLNSSKVVISGSEAARGIPLLMCPPPTLEDTLDSYTSILDGTKVDRENGIVVYAHIQGILSLYAASLARKHPSIGLWVLSPGFTQDSMNKHIQIEENPPPMKFEDLVKAGIAHDYKVAATNFFNAMVGSAEWNYPSGVLLGAANGTSGDICDQASLEGGQYLCDHAKQDLAFEALHNFA